MSYEENACDFLCVSGLTYVNFVKFYSEINSTLVMTFIIPYIIFHYYIRNI